MRLKVSDVILFHYIGLAKLLAWPIIEKLPQISICGTFKCIKLFVSPHQFWNFQLLYLACEVWLSEKFVIVNLTLSSFNFPLYFTSSKGRISITSLYWSQIHRRLKLKKNQHFGEDKMLAFQFLSNKRLFHFKRDIYWISFLFLRYRWFELIGCFSIRRNERK